MNAPSLTRSHPPRVLWSRWALVVLATLFTLGAFGQFFLVGLSFFDDSARWNDRATLGRSIGLLTWVMWIPAIVGRTAPGVIGATILLLILFEAQYAFINVDNTVANALHPLNGSMLLVLGCSITQRAIASLQQATDRLSTRVSTAEKRGYSDTMRRTTP